ncbi:hypothetical protein [Mycolicibacterium mengxianglii]|uniref:hypothetical protein n=1 Tax=Mycolicibacterium mengxianglii TaxID=2736649 RepID=UPI001E60B630|nr:hypothetical protein [Mycolicibacterium mengxianglii]
MFTAPSLTVVVLSAAVFFAPTAAALPQCQDVSPRTTVCVSSGGSHQITTSPPPMDFGFWPGWTYGYWDAPGFVFGVG